MKAKMKKILVLIFAFLFAFTIFGCGQESDNNSDVSYSDSDIEPETRDYLDEIVEYYIQALASFSDEELEMYAGDPIIESWIEVKDDLGAFEAFQGKQFTFSEDGLYKVISIVDFEKETATVTAVMEVDMSSGQLYSFELEYQVNTSQGGSFKEAALNTVLGIGTVFIVLVFLSLLISAFKFIPGASKAAPVADVSVKNEVSKIAEKEDNLTNDLELVAVISAAIAASENTSTDSFVVRSIKRANNNKWRKA